MTAAGEAPAKTVIGVFDDPDRAEEALNGLRDAAIAPGQVSVVTRDQRDVYSVAEGAATGAEGASTGAVLGGITGGILGWLVGIGALVIPGAGPILAAGALATTLGAAALGAVAGGLIGALVDLGVPEDDARQYEGSVRAGSLLLTVHARSDEQAWNARALFERCGGTDVRIYGLQDSLDGAGSGGPTESQSD